MMNPQEQSEFDQQLARMREGLPAMWWALFQGMVDKGFTEQQALRLLCAFIKSPHLGK